MADGRPPEVTSLGATEVSRAGGVLGRAFQEDPLWSAVVPDPELRPARLARMFTGFARTIVAARGVAERTVGFEAVSLWLPPGREIGLWAMARAGFAVPRFAMAMPADDRRRMTAVLRQLGERRKQLVPGPHWYLTAVGVEPDEQGRGLGSALVRSGLREADRDGRPAYLETETEGNVGYYEHLGFEVVGEIVPAGVDVRFWLMQRGADSSVS